MAWKKLCSRGDVPEDSLAKFEVDGVSVVVANHGGAFHAFPPLCPHMAEPLEVSGMCADGVLTCTKHLWQWELPSGNPVGDAEKLLLTYPVKCEGDTLLVEIEKELTYEYD
jgi:toluene monooxygenase system ferredoxin subunit